MSDRQPHREHMDAEDAERLSQQIDTAQGPGPVLEQDTPAPIPILSEDERAERHVHSAIDPAEFAELGQRSGEELDHVRPIGEGDDPGVAGRAQGLDLETQEDLDRMA